LDIHVLIKLEACAESKFRIKNTKLEDWCS